VSHSTARGREDGEQAWRELFGDSAGHGRRADGARAMLVEFISDQANHTDEKRQ
jgi:hypothetical protein